MPDTRSKTSVVIVYDGYQFGKDWQKYLKGVLTERLGSDTVIISILEDKIPPAIESRKNVSSDAKVLIGHGVLVVILTHDHLQYILKHPDFSHKQALLSNALSFSPDNSYLIYFEDIDFKKLDVKGVSLDKRFEQFSKWQKIFYRKEGAEIERMTDSIRDVVDRNAPTTKTPIKAHMINTTVKCDESTTMAILFEKELPTNARVQVYINLPGNPTNFPVETKINNPYVITFQTFEHVEGDVMVKVMVNNDDVVLEPNILTYSSPSTEVSTVSLFYIELLELLVKKLLSLNVDLGSLDELMSSIFSSTHIPAQAFELIFGLILESGYAKPLEEQNDSKFPTLLHLGAAYGLKNFCATLHDLPNAQCALEKGNNKGKLPEKLAEEGGHRDLASFLEDTRKGNLDDLYITMMKSRNLNDTDEIYAETRVKCLKRIGTRKGKWDETKEPEYIFCDQNKKAAPKRQMSRNDQQQQQHQQRQHSSKSDEKINRLSEELTRLFRKFIEQELSIVKTELQFEKLKSDYYGGCKNFEEKKKNAKLLREEVGKMKRQLKVTEEGL